MPQETVVVICPQCHKKNRLSNQITKGSYRCGHCKRQLLPDPFMFQSERQEQTLPGDFSIKKIVGIAVLGVFALMLLRGGLNKGQFSGSSPEPTLTSSPTPIPTLSPSTAKPKPVQRLTDDNGHPFPTQSGYLKGYPALFVGGYSSITVDNSQNNSDVFVKLFSLDTTPPKAASVFFIRAREKFTVEDIQPGNYDVRYRDLSSGELLRTESFNLK